jgi:hypothetical protein
MINKKAWNLKINRNLVLLGIDIKKGFIFKYKGDQILYTFFWNRKNFGGKIISVGFFDMPFKTFKELDEEWDKFAKTYNKI